MPILGYSLETDNKIIPITLERPFFTPTWSF